MPRQSTSRTANGAPADHQRRGRDGSRGTSEGQARRPEADLDALHDLRASLTALDVSLGSSDAVARGLVNENRASFDVFGHLQEVLNLVTCHEDFVEYRPRNPLKAHGLRGPIRTLIAEIDGASLRGEGEVVPVPPA